MSASRPVSTADIVPFTPEKSEGKRTYQLRGLRHRERLRIDMEVLERCGRGVVGEEMRAALRDGVRVVLSGGEQEAALAIVDKLEETLAAFEDNEKDVPVGTKPENVSDEVKKSRDDFAKALLAMTRLESQISRDYRPLARLLRVNAERAGELAALRVQMGVVGWGGEGFKRKKRDGTIVDVVPEFSNGRLTEESMDSIPDVDLYPIAQRVAELSELDADGMGESDSPSGAPTTPEPSKQG